MLPREPIEPNATMRAIEALANACRTFCSLCFVDPALIECYIGMKFEKLTEEN